MNRPFISYLVTCKNTGFELQFLLERLHKYGQDNECIILDDYSDNPDTLQVLDNVSDNNSFFKVRKHKLDGNYSEHKNYGKSLCQGEYIFQIDDDELPSETLLESLKELIELNNDVDLFWISRINDFKGVNPDNAKQWGWRLTQYEDRLIVNWPDPQGRLFKNLPYIEWKRRLHEKVEGAKTYVHLPSVYELALHHNKTIEKQIQTNIKYNKMFTEQENKGFKV
jgi:glycosyltransferase involved in cell wall biosynthesis